MLESRLHMHYLKGNVKVLMHLAATRIEPIGFAIELIDIMKLFYASRKLRRTLCDDTELDKCHGQLASMIRSKLLLLEAVMNLEKAMELRTLGIHVLRGRRKGQRAIKLNRHFRLIVEPCREDGRPLSDEQVTPSETTVLMIREIVDYH